ncbi:MAG TPA: aldo/keto reductase [Acidimicrobiia bacterium]|nr:aldo/keto reductase [Acidimicrobiia bacterium]
MQQRTLGAGGPAVGAVGYGAMPLNWEYGTPVSDAEAKEVVDRALDLGCTLIDTADSYGPFVNEELLGRCLGNRRDEAFVSTKTGLVMTNPEPITYEKNGSPDHIRASCDGSLARLGIDVIDLYTLHRVDPDVPVEESVGAMAGLVDVGKVRFLGLSEVDVTTLERAVSVHPIASVQSELSLWTRGALDDVLPWCTARGVAFLPFSPLGRGFLTGTLDTSSITPADFRYGMPRFEGEAALANQAIVDGIARVGRRHGASNARVALAWLLAQGPMIIPIPGTKRVRYLEDNAGAADLVLTAEDLADLDALPEPVGARY